MALAMATLAARDKGTAEHSDDVLCLCDAMGRQLGFDEATLDLLVAGAQLHDVGKVAVPLSIINKPAALTEGEWAVIREHTVIGERILRAVPEMAGVAKIVRHTHEHWDGSGYPDGLRGEEIPLESRVILCADAFHAMRCDRPYRRGRGARAALAEMEACAGTQFDPEVVSIFTRQQRDAHIPAIKAGQGRRRVHEGEPPSAAGRALGRDLPVPRRPGGPPSHPGGRTDPPAMGVGAGANGHSTSG